MRSRRIKYQLPDSRRNRRGGFFGFLFFLALAGFAGLWWYSDHGRQKPVQTAAARSRPPATVPPMTESPRLVSAPRPDNFSRPAQNVFEAQLALDRQGISCGSLDGQLGSQTRSALRAFQRKEQLPATGELNAETKARLVLAAPPYTTCTITSDDLARLQPLSKTWLGKSQQTGLEFESILELAAELSHAHPDLIRQLNPDVNWTNAAAGTVLRIPDAAYNGTPPRAACLRISLADKTLEAFDAETNLLAHFPCSIAQRVEKRPAGELHVATIARRPNYTFDPEVFPESPEARELKTKLVLPPGPNNPVGIVWIGLDLNGYGIHGTPKPEDVGRTESHGCFRLANWNVELLVKMVWNGLPVYVDP